MGDKSLERPQHVVKGAGHDHQADDPGDEQVAALACDFFPARLALAVERVRPLAAFLGFVTNITHGALHGADRNHAWNIRHAGCIQPQVDDRFLHAYQFLQRALDVRHAGGAGVALSLPKGHAAHIQRQFRGRNRVADIFDSALHICQFYPGGVIRQAGLVGRQVDDHVGDARQFLERPLHVRDARGAGHAGNGQRKRELCFCHVMSSTV